VQHDQESTQIRHAAHRGPSGIATVGRTDTDTGTGRTGRTRTHADASGGTDAGIIAVALQQAVGRLRNRRHRCFGYRVTQLLPCFHPTPVYVKQYL
jgi:hypothetical protein